MRVADYKDLRVYTLAFESAMELFQLSRTWPSEEKYSLTDQIRRSSRSVCTNIAEAWRKRRYEAAFVSKLSDSDGEAAETEVHLDFALRCGYLAGDRHAKLSDQYRPRLRPTPKDDGRCRVVVWHRRGVARGPAGYAVGASEREERVERDERQERQERQERRGAADTLSRSDAPRSHAPDAPHAPRSSGTSRCSKHHRFFAQEQVHRPAGDGGAGARRRLRGAEHSARRHPRPVGHAGHHLHANGQARRRKSSRTRSPIPSRPRCFPCRRPKSCAAIRSTASRSSM